MAVCLSVSYFNRYFNVCLAAEFSRRKAFKSFTRAEKYAVFFNLKNNLRLF